MINKKLKIMENSKSELPTITLDELRERCLELKISSEGRYREIYRTHGFPYMPNIEYRNEWIEKGEWNYLFIKTYKPETLPVKERIKKNKASQKKS